MEDENSPNEFSVALELALLDQVREAVLVRDLEDRIVFWNKSAERLYGWTSGEAIGHNIYELLTHPQAALDSSVSNSLREKGEWFGQWQQITKDGKMITVESRWRLWPGGPSQPQAVLITNFDITEQKKEETQIQPDPKQEAIERLAPAIVHDLNNVFSSILIALRVLGDSTADPLTQRLIEMLRASALDGGRMAAQILSFTSGSVTDAGRLQLPPEMPLPGDGNGEVILVAESAPTLREVTTVMLTKSGYQVLGVSSGIEAITRCAEHKSQLAAVVIGLPLSDLADETIIRALLAFSPKAAIFLTDAQAKFHKSSEISQPDKVWWLQKPVSADTLLSLLLTALGSIESPQNKTAGVTRDDA